VRKIRPLIIAIFLAASSGQAQFFPKNSFDPRVDDFTANWYSAQLRALKEPSLLDLGKDPTAHCFRFLWLRTFHHPIAVRIEVKSDGTGALTIKEASGAGGYAPGRLIRNTNRSLSSAQVSAFLALVDRLSFWTTPNPGDDQIGLDGSQWIIEGVKGGKYHVVDGWSPKTGVAHDLGAFLAFNLAKLSFSKREIY
jgi:hypothetical protein